MVWCGSRVLDVWAGIGRASTALCWQLSSNSDLHHVARAEFTSVASCLKLIHNHTGTSDRPMLHEQIFSIAKFIFNLSKCRYTTSSNSPNISSCLHFYDIPRDLKMCLGVLQCYFSLIERRVINFTQRCFKVCCKAPLFLEHLYHSCMAHESLFWCLSRLCNLWYAILSSYTGI